MNTISYAPDAFRLLNGFFCVYKPSELFSIHVRKTLLDNLSRDFNLLEVRPPKQLVVLQGSVASGHSLSIQMKQNFADHPLVVGPRYQPQDVRLINLNSLGNKMSGIMLMAVNNGCWKAATFRQKTYIQEIEVKAKFGMATNSFFDDGKVVEKSTFHHITQNKMDRVLASIQATHQINAFHFAGVHLESQEAYDLASKGLVRPVGSSQSIVYNIKCTEFNLPHFSLRIHCINGTQEFLAQLVHEMGLSLRSNAVCCQLRQIRFGHFMLDHALLKKHWTLEHILNNTTLCKGIMAREPETDSPLIKAFQKKYTHSELEDMQQKAYDDAL